MSWLDVFSVVLTVVLAFTMPELLILVPMITSALKALGIDESKEAKEMGDRMLQAKEASITPENYENYDDYIKAIENFELDPEKSAKYTDEEKLQKYAATHLTELQSKFGDGAITFLTEVAFKLNNKSLTIDTKAYLDTFGKDIDKVNDYFKGNLSFGDMQNVEKDLVSLERKLSPGKSEGEILKELNNGINDLK